MKRKPARDHYDALVMLDPSPNHVPEFAVALVKLTYEIRDGKAIAAPAEPLLLDVWNDRTLDPPMPPGSDYWFNKALTDVVLHGHAYGEGGRPLEQRVVSLAIGPVVKRVAVFGRRVVEWSARGAPTFSLPEPVERVPLVYQLAYGGLDARVPVPEDQRDGYFKLARAGMQYDHPGLYLRNPVGKGFLALPGPVDDVELPNLEDPDDLLTPDRLVAPSPERWYVQPLPWCFEWTVGLTFPRCLYLGVEPWFPAPDGDELPEVVRGYCAPGLRRQRDELPDLLERYLQEASLGMVLPPALGGQPVRVHGMHPELSALSFLVPAPPRVEFEIESQREAVEPRLVNFALYPDESRFCLTYAAQARLKRSFIPQIHKEIPIAFSVDGDSFIRYAAPPTMHERLQNPSSHDSTEKTR